MIRSRQHSEFRIPNSEFGPPPAVIHIWVPDIESAKGGIQAFSRFFVRAVADVFPAAQITVLSKNDSAPPQQPLASRPVRFDCAGWWPASQRTIGFARLLVLNARREKPDLIVTTHVNFAQVGFWLKRLTGVRLVAVAHGVDVWGPDVRGMRARGMLRALQGADRVLAVSRFTRDRLLQNRSVLPERVSVLPDTFDEEEFVPSPKPHFLLKRFGLRPDQPVILTVARLASADRYKGYDQVLRALPAVRAKVPGVRYILGGSGRDRGRVESLIRELGLEESVTLAGYIPDHELRAFYNLCDVFAMPSKGEGFGIVFLEAIGCGKPVIAGNKDGSVDAVLDGKAGVLIDPDNLDELREALILTLTKNHPLEILRKPEALREMIVRAYGFERFSSQVGKELGQTTEDRGQRTEDRGQRTEDRGQRD